MNRQPGLAAEEARKERIYRIADDPLPPPVIRVGGIGRRNLPGETTEALSSSIKEVLTAIAEAARRRLMVKEVRSQFAGHLRLCLISPLADGADRLIAGVAHRAGYHLGAILPFERSSYETTFGTDVIDSDAARSEFGALLDQAELPHGHGVMTLDGAHETEEQRVDSYRECGKHLLWWSDIIVAVMAGDDWSHLDQLLAGKRNHHHRHRAGLRGREGSQTVESVAEAERLGIPVFLIDGDQQRPSQLIFDAAQDRSISRERVDAMSAALLGLSQPLEISAVTFGRARRRKSQVTLDHYCRQSVRVDLTQKMDLEYAGPYDGGTAAPALFAILANVNKGLTWAAKRYVKWAGGPTPQRTPQSGHEQPSDSNRPAQTLAQLLDDSPLAGPYQEYWLHLHRADVVANAHAALHRSAQTLLPGLVMASVLPAVLKLALPIAPVYFVAAEVAVLLLAVLIMRAARRYQCLESWLASRLLAEILRYSKFLLVTGRSSPLDTIMHLRATERMGHNWVGAYARHLLRAHPLSVPGRGSLCSADAVRTIAGYIDHACIGDQLGYHERTARFHRQLEIGLSAIGEWLTYATIGVAIIELALELAKIHATGSLPIWSGSLVQILATILPAITGAALSWRTAGQHDSVARRSEAMAQHLLGESERLSQLAASEGLSLTRLGDHTVAVVRHLLEDVDGWAEMFAGKEAGMG